MKKTITLLALFIFGSARSQSTADFESFSLPADSFYYDAAGNDFQTTNAVFQYDWNSYWSGGFSYTNKQNVDSGNYRHLYNCIAGKGYNTSNYYATGQAGSFIKLKSPYNGVSGFYVTNTTYAYTSMKDGDAFAKKFGGVTGNDPDWFLLSVFGFSGGAQKTDTVNFYLADFRDPNNTLDYILQNWQWVDCSKLGVVDSVKFVLNSSDVGTWGMNTPAFFSIDNFTTAQYAGINEIASLQNIHVFPNPASDFITINFKTEQTTEASITIYNAIGISIKEERTDFDPTNNNYRIDLGALSNGLYFIEVTSDKKKQSFKLIKN